MAANTVGVRDFNPFSSIHVAVPANDDRGLEIASPKSICAFAMRSTFRSHGATFPIGGMLTN
jgi:hypothetical protein